MTKRFCDLDGCGKEIGADYVDVTRHKAVASRNVDASDPLRLEHSLRALTQNREFCSTACAVAWLEKR